jgi:hypothetical protein
MDYNLKILRDYVLGDGYLVRPCSANAGSAFGCTQGIAQKDWLSYKMKVFSDLGFNMRVKEYSDTRRDSISLVMRSQATQEFRRYYDKWYIQSSSGRMHKNFNLMINECLFDLESLMILYLDDGHSEIVKKVIRYASKKKIQVNPFFGNLSIPCPYHDSAILAKSMENLGFECKALRPYELRSRAVIYRVDSKRRFVDQLKLFCEQRNLQSTFSYKYNLPISGAIND